MTTPTTATPTTPELMPLTAEPTPAPAASACCAPAEQAVCCAPSDKAACCGASPASTCGCQG